MHVSNHTPQWNGFDHIHLVVTSTVLKIGSGNENENSIAGQQVNG